MGRAADVIAEARKALRQGHAAEALVAVERVLSNAPGNLGARVLRANCLIALERLVEAKAALVAIVKEEPERPDAHGALARILEKQEHWEEALRCWRRYARASGNSADARLRLARAALRMGEAGEALLQAETILTEEPCETEAGLLRARALQLLGRLDEAETQLLAMLDERPNASEVVLAAARFAATSRRWLLFKQALSHVAGDLVFDEKALDQLLTVLADAGWFKDALELVRRLRAERPLDHAPWYGEQWLLTRLGDLDARDALLKEARRVLLDAPLELALLLDRIGRFEEAVGVRRGLWRTEDLEGGLTTYRDMGRVDAVHQILSGARGELSLPGHEAWLKDLCRRTSTGPDRLEKAPLEPLSVGLRVFERLCELGRGGSPRAAAPRRVVICNSSFGGLGGAQRATVLALKALTEPSCPFERLVLLTEDGATRERSDHGQAHLLDDVAVEVLSPRSDDAPLPALVEKDPEWHEAWLDLLGLLPAAIRNQVLSAYNVLATMRPDTVMVWGIGPPVLLPMGLAALMARIGRIIVSSRGVGNLAFSQSDRIVGSAVQSVVERGHLRAFLSLPQVSFMTCSRSLRDETSRLLGLDLSDAAVVHNAVVRDFLRGRRPEARSVPSRPTSAGTVTVGGVFRLTLVKQPFLWLEVAKEVLRELGDRDVRFVLIGDGPLFPGLRDAVRELDLEKSVTLVGETLGVGHWLSRFDLLLHTSLSEGLGNTLLEAQLFGVPVVTTDCGSAPEIVRQGRTGWVVDSWEPREIAERLCWCLANEAWLASASRQAREFAQNSFTLESMRAALLRSLGAEERAERDLQVDATR